MAERDPLQPSPEAIEFAGAVADLLSSAADSAALRAAWDSGDGRIPGLWKRLADLGVTGLTVPEEFGGAGLSLLDALPVLMETGRAVLPEPLVETLAAAQLLASVGGDLAREWLPRVASGDAVLAMGPGPGGLVSAAEHADLLLYAADDATLLALPRDAVTVVPVASVDKGMRLGRVDYQRSGATAISLDPAAGVAAFDLAVVAVSAQLVGLARRMLTMSVDYAQTREQFGKPIGSFQAVKHQLADVFVANVFAWPVVRRGAWSVAAALPSRGRDASHAKHVASENAQLAARTALQVHAGIGCTCEHDLHMFMKRTWSLSSLWGDLHMHRGRVAAAVLADGPQPRSALL